MIADIACLTEDECLEIKSKIYNLKKFWTKKDSSRFYTLGAASYIDAAPQNEAEPFYYGKAKLLNPILKENFDLLYKKISDALTQKLEKSIRYRNTFALPGFHIFPLQKEDSSQAGQQHLDLQYKLLNWKPSKEIDFENPISFTLAISLPEFGGGMDICDLPSSNLINMPSEARKKVLDLKTKFYPYKIGNLTIHQGLYYHKIAFMRNEKSDADRITLQGHGLLEKDVWQIYW